MAIDFHIKFDGVDGESTHADHKGEIEVLSWSWAASNAPTAGAAGAGAGKSKSVAGPLTFQHQYDKASPVLAKQCAAGKFFKEVSLTSRKAGDGQKDFLKVTMKEVFVTSVQPAGSSEGGISETVSLTYKDIEFAYKPQDEKGGLGGEVKFGWDVAKALVR